MGGNDHFSALLRLTKRVLDSTCTLSGSPGSCSWRPRSVTVLADLFPVTVISLPPTPAPGQTSLGSELLCVARPPQRSFLSIMLPHRSHVGSPVSPSFLGNPHISVSRPESVVQLCGWPAQGSRTVRARVRPNCHGMRSSHVSLSSEVHFKVLANSVALNA